MSGRTSLTHRAQVKGTPRQSRQKRSGILHPPTNPTRRKTPIKHQRTPQQPRTRQDRVQRLLRQALDNPNAQLRHGQWEAIRALVNRRARLLVVQPTGWGKSAVYFIATRILRDWGHGPTVIVSPLLALMRNQVEAARRLGLRAIRIDSTNKQDWHDLYQALHDDDVDALLVSPERLASDDFTPEALPPIGLLVVDEAHCISDWGHDFRPDYRRLTGVLQAMPDNVPLLATTATANPRVVEDLRAQLGTLDVQRGDLRRDSLALQTLRLPSQAHRLAWLAQHLPELPGTGIVYTLTKRDARLVADWLSAQGIAARAYFSNVEHDDFEHSDAYRQHLEDQLLHNQIKVLVATNALGMGYDKPDLGFVVHYQAPDSIVTYYQQVGRAGRDIPHAVGVLMCGGEDAAVHEYFRRCAFPDAASVQAVLKALEAHDGLTARDLEAVVNLRAGQIRQTLKFLAVETPAPVFRENGRWRRSPAPYRMDRARIERLMRQRCSEWQEMQRYVDTDGCRMAYLTAALGDVSPRACGKCDACLGRPVVASSLEDSQTLAAGRFLSQSAIPLCCPVQVPGDAFRVYGFTGRLPRELQAEKGRALCWRHDEEWGRAVTADMRRGRFRPELVSALVELVGERWQPEPRPEWITCVPSHDHPDLVPDLGRRLAAALQVPFCPVVRKVAGRQPQKAQYNSFHRCRNLDGAFRVEGEVPGGPVLLLDDVVGSGWTLAVVSALLRQAGSGVVWPLALASARSGD